MSLFLSIMLYASNSVYSMTLYKAKNNQMDSLHAISAPENNTTERTAQ